MAKQQWQYSNDQGATWHDVETAQPCFVVGNMYRLFEVADQKPLPCPFCGGKAVTEGSVCGQARYYHCEKCKADGGVAMTSCDALAVWNNRAPCCGCAEVTAKLYAMKEDRDAWRLWHETEQRNAEKVGERCIGWEAEVRKLRARLAEVAKMLRGFAEPGASITRPTWEQIIAKAEGRESQP